MPSFHWIETTSLTDGFLPRPRSVVPGGGEVVALAAFEGRELALSPFSLRRRFFFYVTGSYNEKSDGIERKCVKEE